MYRDETKNLKQLPKLIDWSKLEGICSYCYALLTTFRPDRYDATSNRIDIYSDKLIGSDDSLFLIVNVRVNGSEISTKSYNIWSFRLSDYTTYSGITYTFKAISFWIPSASSTSYKVSVSLDEDEIFITVINSNKYSFSTLGLNYACMTWIGYPSNFESDILIQS